jgi:L-fuconolactonase
MAGPRIDIHPHVLSPDTDRYPLAPVDGVRSTWSAEAKSMTPDQLIAAMDDAGIAKTAVVHSSTTYGFDNSLVADAVAAYPDRLTGVCSVDVLAADAVETLKYWMGRGCTGLRLFTTGSTNWDQAPWLNDPASYPVWAFANETGLSICIQARVHGMAMLRDMMDRFPNVPVVLDHLAHPDLSDGPPYAAAADAIALAGYKQLVVKYTPVLLKYASAGKATVADFMPRLLDAFGPANVAWGSNFPGSPGTLASLLEASEDAISFLSPDERDMVMGGTALRLYPALAD